MSDVNLSKAVRSNLLSLQSTADMMGKTQERLATGLKVNSALDNPTNFFTASSLNSRASDMASLLDAMSNGIKVIEAADNGLSSITKTVETMQSTLRQARQDKSFKTMSYTLDADTIGTATAKTMSFAGGAVGDTPVSIDLNTIAAAATPATSTGTVAFATDGDLQAEAGDTLTLTAGDDTVSFTIGAGSTKSDLTTALTDAGFSASFNGSNQLVITRADGVDFTTSGTGATSLGVASSTNGVEAVAGSVKSVDALVNEINANPGLSSAIRASNDNNKLRIENLSTADLTVTGIGTDGELDGSTGTSVVDLNTVRKNLVKQFNELRDQLDKFSDDASFNGINLLRGDKLKLTFNETGSSTIEIQAKNEDADPIAINNASLEIDYVVDSDFDSDVTLDGKLEVLADALGKLRSHASSFGSNLSIVQNRTDFTKKMINTLETGAANLTLADTNEEAANLLALQTRQQLSSTALSMASQSDQAVLRLF